MIFIDETGTVLNVIANAEPFTEDPRPSEGVALAVLEVQVVMDKTTQVVQVMVV